MDHSTILKYIPFRKYQFKTWGMIWKYWAFFCCVMYLKEPNKYLSTVFYPLAKSEKSNIKSFTLY